MASSARLMELLCVLAACTAAAGAHALAHAAVDDSKTQALLPPDTWIKDHGVRGEECAFINNTDVAGANIKWEKKTSPSDCCAGCEATPGCKAAVHFEYAPDGSGGGCCYYKSADTEVPKPGSVAVIPGKPQPPPPPPPPSPVPVPPPPPGCTTWLDDTKIHNATTFRNARAFGAKGDGVTDDTAAINRALSQGRDIVATLVSQPAVVYLPPGVYAVSKTLQMGFDTFIHGNPLCKTKILWMGSGIVIGGPPSCDHCEHTGDFFYGVTGVSVDLSKSGNTGSVAVHWPVSQGTYLRNMTLDVGPGKAGIFGESGSGGLIADVNIRGGDYGMQFGNQQWTFRDVSIAGARLVGIQIIWNWVFSFIGLKITNCPVGISWPSGGASLLLLDSTFESVGIAVNESIPGNGFFLLENITTRNVTYMLTDAAAKQSYKSWRQGPALEDGSPIDGSSGELPTTSARATALKSRPRPYCHGAPEAVKDCGIVSVVDYGAKGDGVTDDSAALQKAINAHRGVFLPFGNYLIANTVTLTSTTVLFGEAYSMLQAGSGNPDFAKNISEGEQPTPMLTMPEGSSVSLVDLTLGSDGPVPGCLLLDWKNAGPDHGGMWDVMYRIEHTVWGQLRLTGTAGGYFENMWLWVADHDLNSGKPLIGKDAIDSPRGALFQNTGTTYLYGVAAEHSSQYQYSLDGASDITFVLSQSETPYWQNPPTALAMKIHDSKNIRSYGAAYECWFHGIETSLLEVVGSPSTFLYLPNTKNASHIVSGDTEVLAADPRYNITGHFTQSFVASIP